MLIWSPKPGVSVNVSLSVTPFSSMTVESGGGRDWTQMWQMGEKVRVGAHLPWVTECSCSVWGVGPPRPRGVVFHTLDLNSVFTIVDLPSPLCPGSNQMQAMLVHILGSASQTLK